jgi:hypothetical protein
MIVATGLVKGTNVLDFGQEVLDRITEEESQGYNVETHYSTTTVQTGIMYSAFFIMRNKS